jgi:N1221-like protein
MEEVLTEISVYLGMLYHLIEAFKGHDDFADELSMSFIQFLNNHQPILVSLDPPLPVYIFTVVAGLREKNAKGYPIKKVSSLLSLLQVSFDNPVASPSFMENSIDVLGRNT